ncbi:MAG: hypothetical protein AAGF23_22725 [Acidobacteriota bacterium]
MFSTLAVLVLWLLASAALASDHEMQVNEHTPGSQNGPAIAPLLDGRFLVVWEGPSPALSYTFIEIRGRLLDAAGVPTGSEFSIGETPQSPQSRPAVAALSDGSVAVAWEEGRVSGGGIAHRRVSSAGVPLGQPQLLPTEDFKEFRPLVESLHNGGYLLVWGCFYHCLGGSESDIVGQVFGADSTSVGPPFLVPTSQENDQRSVNHAVVNLGPNGLLVLWDTRNVPPRIRGQRFDANGDRIGGEMLFPDITATGARAYTFTDDEFFISANGILQRYDLTGTPVGSPVALPEAPGEDYQFDIADVVPGPDGHLWIPAMVTPTTGLFAFNPDIGLYELDADGQLLTRLDRANALSTRGQLDPVLALTAGGDPVLVWESIFSLGNDQDSLSVQVRTSFSTLFVDDFEGGNLLRWHRVQY